MSTTAGWSAARNVAGGPGSRDTAAYRHFVDHDELLTEVADRCMAALAGLIRQRSAAVTAADPVQLAWDRLDATGRAYTEFRGDRAGLVPDRVRDQPGPRRAGPRRTRARSVRAAVGRPGRAGGGRGPAAGPPDRRPGAETAARATVHGLSTLLVEGPLRQLDPTQLEPAIATVLAVVRRGL